MTRKGFAGLAVGAAFVLLLAACGSSGAGTTAAPSGTPSADDGAGPALFTARQACSEASPPPNPDPDLSYVTCEQIATDPRMTGRTEGTGQLGGDDAVATIIGEYTLVTDGGSWACKELIVGTMEGGVGGTDAVCRGQGAYATLVAYLHGISDNAASDWGFIGWIDDTP